MLNKEHLSMLVSLASLLYFTLETEESVKQRGYLNRDGDFAIDPSVDLGIAEVANVVVGI